ncbi:MAG: 5' nucleotidase, NT5C type [Kiritimatiellia bacterium]
MPESRSIYVDFDDVLCETARGLMGIAAREFGWRGKFTDLHSFDLGISLGLGPTEVETLMHFAHNPEILLGFEPIPGACDGMRRLRAAGFDLVVVTGRPAHTRDASRAWLDRHGIGFASLLIADKYGRFRREQGDEVLDLEQLAAMQFCLAVEDAPEALEFLLSRTSAAVILFDRPWNRKIDCCHSAYGHRLRRCRTWPEVTRTALQMLDTEEKPQGE